MKRLIAVVSLLLLASTSGYAQNPDSFADMLERVMPSVVSISVVQNNPQQRMNMDAPQFPPGSPFEQFFKNYRPNFPQDNKAMSMGSGFVVSASGVIMTNSHVIENAEDINVIFNDGYTTKATLLSLDKKTDIALLKIETDKKIVPVKFGDSDKARIGDWILAIGNPFGLGSTVTKGIISARARDIQAGPYDDFIQTDAPINRGNSGGPMINVKGEVIGINTAIFSPSGGSVGIGFAIPSNMAKMVYDNLMKHGKIRRGQIGIKVQSITEEIAQTLGLTQAEGALVAGLDTGGAAEKAGIKVGDVILSFDGTDITSMRQLPKIVAGAEIGKQKDIVVWRDGKKQTLKVTPEEMIETQPTPSVGSALEATPAGDGSLTIEQLGLTIANITAETKNKYKLSKDSKGVVITNIDRESEAFNKGIKIGDVIVEVKQTPINKIGDVSSLIAAAQQQDLKSVLVLVDSKEGLKFIALKIK